MPIALRAMISSTASLLLLVPGAASAQFVGYKTVPVADKNIISRGASFNFATLELGPSCIDWKKTIDNSKEFGAAEFNDNQRLDSSTDIASSLSVSYRSLFKGLSSSDSLEGAITNELHYSEDKLTWLFRARKAKQATIIDDNTVTLRDDVPTDPIAFRERCGDYYVAGYATASTFYGIFELDRGAFDSNTTLAVKAEESVDTLIASGSESTELKAALKTAFSHKQARVVERASGSGADQSLRATDLESLLTDFRTYKGDSPAPVSIILAPYRQKGSVILTSRETDMEDNAKLWFDYRRVLDLADKAIATPETFYPQLPESHKIWKKADIDSIRSAIVRSQGWVADGIAACGQDPAKCGALRDRVASGSSPEEEQARLPKYLAWPDDCTAIKGLVPDAPDGEYPLFFQHLPSNRYTAVCRNMAGSPTTYLKLLYVELPDDAKQIAGSNFSQFAPDKDDHHWTGTLVMTSWRGVAIDPKSMRVDRANFGMAQSNGGDVDTHGDDGHLTRANYAAARQCDGVAQNSGLARANLDLRGTGFQVDIDRSKLSTGYWYNGANHDAPEAITLSNGGQVANFATHYGYCSTAQIEPLYLMKVRYGQ